jgi:hypothetical protein
LKASVRRFPKDPTGLGGSHAGASSSQGEGDRDGIDPSLAAVPLETVHCLHQFVLAPGPGFQNASRHFLLSAAC